MWAVKIREREDVKETGTDQLMSLNNWIIHFRLVEIPVCSFQVGVQYLAMTCHDLYHLFQVS